MLIKCYGADPLIEITLIKKRKPTTVFNLIYGSCSLLMGNVPVVSVDPGTRPVSVGKDEYGIFEP